MNFDSSTEVFRGQLHLFLEDEATPGTFIPIAFGTSASLSLAVEEVDVSNKMVEGNWKYPLPGQKSFTISSESMMTFADGKISFGAILKIIKGKGTLKFRLGQTSVTNVTPTGGTFVFDDTKPFWYGEVMPTSAELTSEQGGIATFSSSMVGCGILEDGVVVEETP